MKKTNYIISKKGYSGCDIAILFGGYQMIPTRAKAAIDLYKNKRAKKILITGGIGYFNKNKKDTEANILYEYICSNGVNKDDIILECKSRNTYQNVKNSFELLSRIYNINKISIILITSDFHMKRCLYLSKAFFKTERILCYPVTSDKVNLNNWKNTHQGRKLIIQEFFLYLLCKLKK